VPRGLCETGAPRSSAPSAPHYFDEVSRPATDNAQMDSAKLVKLHLGSESKFGGSL